MNPTIYKGTIYQIRNRIVCGLGTQFKRVGKPYTLSAKGELKRDRRIHEIRGLIKTDWELLP